MAFKCKDCGTRLVILPTKTGSILPVEIEKSVIAEDDIFDGNRHVSHLKNCEGMQRRWSSVKRGIMKRRRREDLRLNLK